MNENAFKNLFTPSINCWLVFGKSWIIFFAHTVAALDTIDAAAEALIAWL